MVQVEQYIIIYLDLVGYAKKNETIQIDLFKALQKEVHYALYDEIANEKAILIPTGDGMIIGIKDDKGETYIKALDFITYIYEWESNSSEKLRSAIHVGDISIIKDINGNNNMVGNSVNNASRMLSGAEDGSIIISKEFHLLYLDSSNIKFNVSTIIDDIFSYKLIDEDSVIDKHGYEHSVYSVVIYKNNIEYGLEAKILNKYFTNIYSTDYPKKKSFDDFLERVKNAHKLTLFGIYHPSTIEILKKLDTTQHLEIDIYFASDSLQSEIEQFFGANDGKLNFENKQKALSDIKSWYKNSNDIKLNIFEYKEFYPFGFSMIDGDSQRKGYIHFSNYIPNIIPEEIPYVEVEWKTNNMPPIYKFYFGFINKLLENKNIDKVRSI
jgi:hypothetical protein